MRFFAEGWAVSALIGYSAAFLGGYNVWQVITKKLFAKLEEGLADGSG